MMDFSDFLEDYRRTWETAIATADVSALTRFFHVSYIAVGPDGGVTVVNGENEIRSFNQKRRELFTQDKTARIVLRGCDALTLGAKSALVTANWENQRADGTVARAWRHFYNLARTEGGLKILVSTFSAGSHAA